MQNLLEKLSAISSGKLKFWVVLVSILVASQVQYIQHGWINPDSILYLESAKLFVAGEWKAGFDTFPWPLYSLTIAITHHLTGLSIHHAAQFLNVLFFGLASFAFIKIVEVSGGKQTEIAVAGLVFLSAPYLVGTVLEMLMRDEGFWAFFLLSVYFFICYYQQHKLQDAFLWQISIILATLFRIEAILYLIFLPLIFCADKTISWSARIQLLWKSYCLQFAIALLIIIGLLVSDKFSAGMLGRLNELLTAELFNNFVKLFVAKSQIMSEQVLGKFLAEYATVGLILTMIYVMFIKMINATGLLNVGMAFLTIKKQPRLLEGKSFKALLFVASIAILNMALIITKVFVLSGRYVLALSFVLMIFASFYLSNRLKRVNTANQKTTHDLISLIILVIICFSFVKNLTPKGDGYNYMQDAISWLKTHNPSNTPVYYNEARLRYFAGEPFIGKWDNNLTVLKDALDSGDVSKYSILAIAISDRHLNSSGLPDNRLKNYKEIRRFSDVKKRKHVIIYAKDEAMHSD